MKRRTFYGAALMLLPVPARLTAQQGRRGGKASSTGYVRGTPGALDIWVRTEDGAATHGDFVEAPASKRRDTAVVFMHPRDNHGSWMQGPFAQAGYSSYAIVARHNTDLEFAMWETQPLDLAAAVKFVLDKGYKRVVIAGNSASGPLLTSYQDLAENADERRKWWGSNRYEIPPTAGLLLSNPTPGHSVTFLRRLDPAVVDEDTGRRDPSLDMFNPENWIAGDPKTSEGVRYSEQFLTKYYKAQSVRLNRLMDVVEEKLKMLEAGRGRFNDDDMVVITGTYAKPCYLDLSLEGTKNGVLKTDAAYGPSGLGVRPVRNTAQGNLSIREASRHSYRAFLSFRAIRSTHPYTGLDYSTSNAITPYHIARVSVPILFLISTGDEQVSPADLDENSKPIRKGVDVSHFFVKGASHGYTRPEWREVAAKGALEWLDTKFS